MGRHGINTNLSLKEMFTVARVEFTYFEEGGGALMFLMIIFSYIG